jgi:hypothetical protein
MCNGTGSTKSSALKLVGLIRPYATEVFQPSEISLSWLKKATRYGSGSTKSDALKLADSARLHILKMQLVQQDHAT